MRRKLKHNNQGLNDPITEPVESTQEEDPHESDLWALTPAFSSNRRRNLGVLLVVTTLVLVGMAVSGLFVERQASSPLIEPGQVAPGFALPSTDGPTISLSQARGRPVLLVFVPAVNCGFCREQLVAVQGSLSQLKASNVVIYAISTDTVAVQRMVKKDLGLDFPILSEEPAVNQHPAGTAYGFYHQTELTGIGRPGPVDSNGLVMIDPAGIVRAVKVDPGQSISTAEILQFVRAVLKAGWKDRRSEGLE